MPSFLRSAPRLPLGALRRVARRLRSALLGNGYRPELHYMRGGRTAGSRGASGG